MFYRVDSRSVNSVAQVCSLMPNATQQLFISLFIVNSKRYISHNGVCGCQICNFSFNIGGGGAVQYCRSGWRRGVSVAGALKTHRHDADGLCTNLSVEKCRGNKQYNFFIAISTALRSHIQSSDRTNLNMLPLDSTRHSCSLFRLWLRFVPSTQFQTPPVF